MIKESYYYGWYIRIAQLTLSQMGLWPSQTQNAMVSVSHRTRAGRAGKGLGMKMKEGNWSFH